MTRQTPTPLVVGDEVELQIGPVAHGGHFVARHEGQVIFVRHALTGERVRAQITDVRKRHATADAIEVLDAAPQRVQPPCKYAHADGCGGCDFQHVAVAEQRLLKQRVVEEQLRRLAGVEIEVPVEQVGSDDGLRWRTRMQYVDLPGGKVGLRAHHSHRVIEIDDCLIARTDARRPSPATITETVTEAGVLREFRVAGDGFWQVHPDAPEVLVAAVLDLLQPQPGETAWDLYGGVGLFAAFLADRVGESGRVITVEQDRKASDFAADNLADLPQVGVIRAATDRALAGTNLGEVDVVVLDPPRSGAKAPVVRAIANARPRAIAYVACDPAALARDVGEFARQGYALRTARAFDLFPMTHHVECVALLEKSGSDLR